MIPGSPSAIQALIKAGLPLVEAARPEAQAPARLPPWQPGQRVEAQVTAALPNQRYLIDADGATLEARLPPGTQVGSRISLTFVSADARPLFLLSQGETTAPPTVRVSDTARFLSQLLNRPEAAAPRPTASTAPLLPVPPQAAPELARALSTALATSGLFYESHQAQWAAGQRPLEHLLAEPQGRLSPRVDMGADRIEKPQAAEPQGRLPSRLDAQQSLPGSPQPSSGKSEATPTTVQAPVPQRPEAKPGDSPSLPGVDARTLPVVREQAQVLENRMVVWQGEVWPGQQLRWEVEEREARGNDDEVPPQPGFRTRIEVDLPRLGRVAATVDLAGRSVLLDVNTERAESARLIARHGGELADALEAAGLATRAFKVSASG